MLIFSDVSSRAGGVGAGVVDCGSGAPPKLTAVHVPRKSLMYGVKFESVGASEPHDTTPVNALQSMVLLIRRRGIGY